MTATTSPIHIVTPIAGTVRWSRSGRNLGVWGRDFPVRPLVLLSNGDVRDLSPAEAKFYKHVGAV
ncbi:hypothetical protein [Jannaschia sp. CCS1]|uniref:hypothetical protein n=1 Tax=Jannaschia sp. (strain CCS1) TaxID=290400 RepID=UPI00140FFC70|nr:hypothetical protein [Jannaschia sp. CCS1]